ncbi:MAG: 4-(cytidine 5'-diphospho)-2-C-methyl-D-erythritol kinase [Alphaproteobacteria bacterium]|nr:4-(cytidine 5'-diphospho)-2-C-methyl-D-erythritol kinase [Alphaproteobacteria bacterium]MBP9877074.1 4-(cytidine 5'-diphospho)-2-C-methyl-D-erythritol kinase [Alphaproteobacteria bacterium]
MHLKSPAKINLYLHLFGKRMDGYHALETFFCPINFYDEIRLEQQDLREESQLLLADKVNPEPDFIENNIILKTIRAFDRAFGTKSSFKISLKKNIPIQAGLGGGSSNAASMLLFLAEHHQKSDQKEKLIEIGASLGADVPGFLFNGPSIARGLGEKLEKAPTLPDYTILLVNPRIPISTPHLFRQLSYPLIDKNTPSLSLPTVNFDIICHELKNDLELKAIEICPPLSDLLDSIRKQQGCFLARLSGSGATCYGLFHTDKEAQKAEKAINEQHPTYWTRQAKALGEKK